MLYSIQRIILLFRNLLLSIENPPTNNSALNCSNYDSQISTGRVCHVHTIWR